ncbi:WD40-repeat-containing domain protein [Gamsiella multidivaricata]|uniref:WD40-repeat-containing domain protein n=1 Tax=Gamsiella multidivaricata TaxID=101098 RepID=UPI0022204192|nr:WD40-repeat-containing domain protein [Gamsiella multidivaricata]KAG0350501.1 ribosome biosynthesis protein rrb1 [Gamsiella multidivaricata]KAI7824415.1 WD40-repeat-containing domain protein [Gamsiella multidivaricata]
MSKRIQDNDEDMREAKSAFNVGNRHTVEDEGMGEFEDPWEDEVESDQEVIIENDDDDEDGMDLDQANEMDQDKEEDGKDIRVYLPGQALEKDEVLEADQSAYEMLHSMNVKWPCLSFDILWDQLGDERCTFPATAYVVTGTQADLAQNNEVLVMKMSQLAKTKNDDGNLSDDDSDDEEVDEDPILEYKSMKHQGGVNRIRAMPQRDQQIAATWADTGKVHIWDLAPHIRALDQPGSVIPESAKKPIYTVESHGRTEGFAMDWSETVPGRLLTGDLNGKIYMTTLNCSTGAVTPDRVPFVGHQSSIEDLQWSPSEKGVFASCSADQTVRIWDIRSKKRAGLVAKVHTSDVNVISWNKKLPYMLASGSDDGVFSVWDLRQLNENATKPTPIATFKWHQAPITSIEWHPTDESVLAVAGADDQITLWDFSVEHDAEETLNGTSQKAIVNEAGVEVPPQLMFVHQGQQDVKELHWHRQIPGCVISTAESGFNIFKTISI